MTRSARGSAFWMFIFGIAFGAVLGAVLMHKYLADPAAPHPAPDRSSAPSSPSPAEPENSQDAFARILRDWQLTPEDIRRRLNNTGQVLRREGTALGARVDEATLDARIITVIKAKFTLDRMLSVWDISVTSTNGRVTLSGTVNQPDLEIRAVVIALDTKGVVDVHSELRVKTSAQPTLASFQS